jgi:hypothetical protein
MKQQALKLRDEGNKAMVVNVPPNPLSRGHHGMGYAVYWIESPKNIEDREKEQKENFRLSLLREREKLVERLEEINEQLGAVTFTK